MLWCRTIQGKYITLWYIETVLSELLTEQMLIKMILICTFCSGMPAQIS